MNNKKNNEFDVVIIGSGFGGGTVALRLAQAGKRVLVLERGRRWRGANLEPAAGDPASTPFPELGDTHFFWGRQIWRPARQRLGLFEIRQMPNLQGLLGAGVGGGSLIWANVVIEAPEEVFSAHWPREINRTALEPYYRKADPYLRPAYVPGVPGIPDGQKGRAVRRAEVLEQAAARVGRTWRPVRVAVNFGDDKQAAPNGHGARQLGCNYCGLCSAGCPQNAKNTVDVTYIAAAEALGAEVRPLHEVTAVEPVAGGYRVHYRRYQPDGSLAESGSIEAPRVVVSAGTFGSTELMLKSKHAGYLTGLSQALGSRFSINGNVLSGALKPGSSRKEIASADTNSGPAITGMIDYGDFAIEDYPNPTWANGIVGGTSFGRIKAFLLALMGVKPSARSLARKVADLLVYVGVSRDAAGGQLKLSRLFGLSLTWPGGINADPAVRKLHAALKELAEAQGRRYVPNVFSIFNRPFTYHPLGGCPMADTEQEGVVDSCGRVFNYPGLYIADGSIVPTAIGRNPSYTIAALSERIAEKMLQDMQRFGR